MKLILILFFIGSSIYTCAQDKAAHSASQQVSLQLKSWSLITISDKEKDIEIQSSKGWITQRSTAFEYASRGVILLFLPFNSITTTSISILKPSNRTVTYRTVSPL